MMGILNLTPHPVTIYRPDTPAVIDGRRSGLVLATIPPSGRVARIAAAEAREAGTVTYDGVCVPLRVMQYGQVEGLPAPSPGTFCIVSLPLALAARRDDLLVPYPLVRGQDGSVLGCTAFAVDAEAADRGLNRNATIRALLAEALDRGTAASMPGRHA